jgi:hypothetical protein
MAQLFIHLAFSKIETLDQLSGLFIDLRKMHKSDHVQILIDFDVASVPCDHLMLVIAYVKSLEAAGIHCSVDFPNLVHTSAPVQQAAQIGFFRHLGMDLGPVKGSKHCTCLCTEISSYDDSTAALMANRQIIKSITDNTSINPSVSVLVYYCLSELMDNVLTHAKSPIGGFVVSQYAPFQGELRLLVCDTGVGLFSNVADGDTITARQADAIKGKGLERTTRFAVANKGELIIHSGSNTIRMVDGKTSVEHASYWQGSYVFMRVKTEQLVDYRAILEEDAILFDNEPLLGGASGVEQPRIRTQIAA